MASVPSLDVLAFLLGHECAHAVLRHGGETMSEQPIVELAGFVLTSALSSLLPLEGGYTIFQSILLRIGLAASSLPLDAIQMKYSREHEAEADQVGFAA